jgi:DNA-binding response OmpR family regulator
MSSSAQNQYTITLDDHQEVSMILSKITKIRSEWYPTPEALFSADVDLSLLIGFFIDINLDNGREGLDYIPQIKRQFPNLPIFVISANDRPHYFKKAFEVGGVDFIRKPFVHEEVRARFSTRISENSQKKSSMMITFGDIQIDAQTGQMTGPLGKATLTQIEVRFLTSLANSKGMSVSREAITERSWLVEVVTPAAVLKKAHEIRGKLSIVSDDVKLMTLRGSGFKLIAS